MVSSKDKASTAELSFAEKQLAKYGWKRGKGLGLNEDGITTHVRVRKKDDNFGIGVGSDTFGFAWWDHVYNRSANFVKVEKDNDGSVQVKCLANKPHLKTETGIISTERPSTSKTSTSVKYTADQASKKSNPASALLYSSFVKSATNSQSAHRDVFDETQDYSIKISDAELFAACGRRTARKGARGQQNGKLSRVDSALAPDGKSYDDNEQDCGRTFAPSPAQEERKKCDGKRKRNDESDSAQRGQNKKGKKETDKEKRQEKKERKNRKKDKKSRTEPCKERSSRKTGQSSNEREEWRNKKRKLSRK